MEKEDVALLIQLLTTMKELTKEIENSYEKKDSEKLAAAKREILELQSKINSLI